MKGAGKPPASNAGDEVYVTGDDRPASRLSEGDEIAITKAERPIRLIRALDDADVFRRLCQKLKWNFNDYLIRAVKSPVYNPLRTNYQKSKRNPSSSCRWFP